LNNSAEGDALALRYSTLAGGKPGFTIAAKEYSKGIIKSSSDA
jgi:hypothetical protein